ncbi:MAG: hypothetical protein GKS05_00340 [Nitrospirales bacterium]|nr:hypothetical protein [Nitrospirales bacterium]
MMNHTTHFDVPGTDSKCIVGDRLQGQDRQILFVNGFLSKRWGNKSKALADLCRQRHWGFFGNLTAYRQGSKKPAFCS